MAPRGPDPGSTQPYAVRADPAPDRFQFQRWSWWCPRTASPLSPTHWQNKQTNRVPVVSRSLRRRPSAPWPLFRPPCLLSSTIIIISLLDHGFSLTSTGHGFSCGKQILVWYFGRYRPCPSLPSWADRPRALHMVNVLPLGL